MADPGLSAQAPRGLAKETGSMQSAPSKEARRHARRICPASQSRPPIAQRTCPMPSIPVPAQDGASASVDAAKPSISITYCRQCGWMLRAAWMAQELLSTFSEDIGAVTLIPGTGGVFLITCDGTQIWERKADGGFPEAKILKQKVRDLVWPERDLGHSDGHSK